nr:hypothetical protein [Tanacetum cinerariifolium]
MVFNSPYYLYEELASPKANGSWANGNCYIHYALTVSPQIYISCIKPFRNTAVVKRSGDVTRLQALVEKKKIVISEDVIRGILRLDDAEGVALSQQLIKKMDAEIEGRQADTQAEIYNIDFDHSSKVLSMQEDDVEVQEAVEIITTAKLMTEVVTAAATQVFANMRRVGKGCSGIETPLFENMLEIREVDAEEVVQVPAHDDVDQENVIEEIADDVAPPTSPLLPSPIIPSSPPHQSPRTSPS